MSVITQFFMAVTVYSVWYVVIGIGTGVGFVAGVGVGFDGVTGFGVDGVSMIVLGHAESG